MVTKCRHKVVGVFLVFLLAMPLVMSASGFARVSVSPREGFVRQPFKVSISVYSPTWFTEALQFSNLRVEDAFIIPFTRTVSSIQYINKKKYATLTFYYLVFPYHSGDLEIPEISITASIPPEGDYRGVSTQIVTTPQKIKVNDLPDSEEDVWMVATGLDVEQGWSKSLEQVKVGEVIERTITLTAYGTLPSLIIPLELEEPAKVSLYPGLPQLKDLRTTDAVNGRRTQTYSYLFEEEGAVVIPEIELFWWHPRARRIYKKVLPEQIIHVTPNPDLSIMQSLKDSLDAIATPAVVEMTVEETHWKRSVTVAIIILLSFWVVYLMTTRAFRSVINRRNTYLKSEEYYASQVKKAIGRRDVSSFVNALYLWFDQVRLEPHASLRTYLSDDDELFYLESIKPLFKGGEEALPLDKQKLLRWFANLRKRVKEKAKNPIDDQLNP